MGGEEVWKSEPPVHFLVPLLWKPSLTNYVTCLPRQALKMAGLSLGDIGVFELHEAFAGQVVIHCTLIL